VLVLPTVLFADDWPQFRGSHQGLVLETNLPVSWSATENVRWKTPLPGPGHSSPIVWGDRIFLTAYKPEPTGVLRGLLGPPKGQLLVLCLSKRTGRVLWEREVPADSIEGVHRTNAPASPTPVTDGNLVYVYFGSKGLTAFDFEGNRVWEKSLGPFPNQWGSASSPVLYGNLLLLISDSDAEDFLLAADKTTGETVWQTSRSDVTRSWSVPVIWSVDDRDQIVVSGSGNVKAYDPKTGRELWKVRGLTKWVTPAPVAAHGLLYVTANGPGGNVFMAIRPGGRGDISDTHVAWRYNRSAPYISSPVVVGDYLYAVKNGGIMTCLNARTGDVVWQERLPARGSYYASLIAGAGRVYAVSEDGEATVVAAKPDFEILSSNPMGERVMATPAVSDGQMFIRSDETLFAIGTPRP
jgi:outer membrane protein assembly factor BamB